MQLRIRRDEGCVGRCEQQNCAEARRHSATRHAEGLGPEVLTLCRLPSMAQLPPPAAAASAPAALDEASTAAPAAFARTEEQVAAILAIRGVPAKDLKKLSHDVLAEMLLQAEAVPNPPPLPTAQAPRRAMAAAEGPAAAAVAAADAEQWLRPFRDRHAAHVQRLQQKPADDPSARRFQMAAGCTLDETPITDPSKLLEMVTTIKEFVAMDESSVLLGKLAATAIDEAGGPHEQQAMNMAQGKMMSEIARWQREYFESIGIKSICNYHF